MNIPVLIAHGEKLIPMMVVGLPAAVIGLVCWVVWLILTLNKKSEDKKARRFLAIAGTALLLLALVSPSLHRVVIPLLNRVTGR